MTTNAETEQACTELLKQAKFAFQYIRNIKRGYSNSSYSNVKLGRAILRVEEVARSLGDKENK